jgi:hypothetical protein
VKIKNFDPSQWVSIGTAAALAGVARSWMRVRAKEGTVSAIEIDGQWFVLRSDAEKYERHPSVGRPRKLEGRGG